jgi:hypothetical protein
MSLSKVRKSMEGSGLSTPGFLQDAIKKHSKTSAKVPWFTYSKIKLSSPGKAGRMKNMLDR